MSGDEADDDSLQEVEGPGAGSKRLKVEPLSLDRAATAIIEVVDNHNSNQV